MGLVSLYICQNLSAIQKIIQKITTGDRHPNNRQTIKVKDPKMYKTKNIVFYFPRITNYDKH
jgi:hypothetical protein